MDKRIINFCKDNPKFTIPCSVCGQENIFNSKEVFEHEGEIFKFICKHCSKLIDYNSDEFIEEFHQSMLSMGFTFDES